VGDLSKIAKAASRLEQVYERQPTPEELAEELETTPEKVSGSLANAGKHLSYDSPFSSEEDNTLLDVLQSAEPGTDKGMMSESLRIDVAESMRLLDHKEREILEMFFGLKGQHSHSLEEIGDKFHLTRERVRQIKDKALGRLRGSRRASSLKTYLN
jgi:RNA polymerase primary sigma factor